MTNEIPAQNAQDPSIRRVIDAAKTMGGVKPEIVSAIEAAAQPSPEKPAPKLGVDKQELAGIEVRMPDPAVDDAPKELEVLKPAEVKNGQLILTPKHLELIKSQMAKDATPAEFELFLMMAYRTRLDPIMKQLYFIKYGGKVNYVTSIDGYRIIAHRTGDFAGIDEPRYDYSGDGKLAHCAITVYKIVQGIKCGFSAKVKFSEYTTGQNNWAKMPETMIAKVAEAHALRKAFPNDLSGIYTQDEMDQMENQKRVNAPAKRPAQVWATSEQIKDIKILTLNKGKTIAALNMLINQAFGGNSVKDLSSAQAAGIINRLKKMPDVGDVVTEEQDDGQADLSALAHETLASEPQWPDVDDIDQGINNMRAAQ